jgi:peptidoglycan/LPS O-acetylase OafA/YrhL
MRRRNVGIDLLRGIAVILVAIHHFGLRVPLKESFIAELFGKKFANALIYSGYEAVFIFFVISGFVIATRSLERWGRLQNINMLEFYVHRAARILPCLIVLLAVLSGLHLAGVEHYTIYRTNQSLSQALAAALGFYLNWYEGRTGYLPAAWDVLWSLSIEEVFYIAFPIVCLFAKQTKWLVVLLILLALSLPISRAALDGNEIWQQKAYLPGMAAIAKGVLAALMVSRFSSGGRITTNLVGTLGLAGLVAVIFAKGILWTDMALGNGVMLILTSAVACLLMASYWQARRNPEWKLPGTGWIRSCGRLSYEIYLTHIFVMWPFVDLFKKSGGDLYWAPLWYLPLLSGSWALGFAVERMLTTPAYKWILRCLSYRRPEVLDDKDSMKRNLPAKVSGA